MQAWYSYLIARIRFDLITMMLFFSAGAIVQDGTPYFRDHASASNPGWNLFTLNAMFLQAKPYYLSNLWKLFCQPYYFIVSAPCEKTIVLVGKP